MGRKVKIYYLNNSRSILDAQEQKNICEIDSVDVNLKEKRHEKFIYYCAIRNLFCFGNWSFFLG